MTKKEKIAISISNDLIKTIDTKIDGNILRSRSQAIEFFLYKGLKEVSVDTAVILLSRSHQECALKDINGKSLIRNQIAFFEKYGVKKIFIVTQHSSKVNKLAEEVSGSGVRIFEKELKGNAEALQAIKDKISENNFIVMSGDILNSFDLRKMIDKHIDSNKLATMGLMSRDKPSMYGAVVLDGDLIIDFKEKSKDSQSHVVNAGIYCFKPNIFNFIDPKDTSLEKHVFPRIAKNNQLVGFFTHGNYIHVPEVKTG